MTMHQAPAVDYPVERSSIQLVAVLVLCTGAIAVMLAWFGLAVSIEWRHWLGMVVLAAAATAALMGWFGSAVGTLRWDGRSWSMESKGKHLDGAVDVCLDAQKLLVLRFRSAGHRRWLWLAGTTLPERWSALRRAAHTPAPAAGDSALSPISVQRASRGHVARP